GIVSVGLGVTVSGAMLLGNGGTGTIVLSRCTVQSGTGAVSASVIQGPVSAQTTTFALSSTSMTIASLTAWAGSVSVTGTTGATLTITTVTMTGTGTSLSSDGPALSIVGG